MASARFFIARLLVPENAPDRYREAESVMFWRHLNFNAANRAMNTYVNPGAGTYSTTPVAKLTGKP
jgi:hypothetical protein